MTEHINDRENQSAVPGRPEGQDAREHMDDKTTHDPDTTEVLPAAATPPTQEVSQATQQIPEDMAPEGEVHPAYGVATPVATIPASGPQPGPAQQPQAQPTLQAQPAQQAAQAVAQRGPRVGTAVWGLIVIAVGLGILAVSAGVVFDLGVALIVLLGAAGVILVAGSVISSLRRR